MGDTPAEEKRKIAQQFLLNSPPGQFSAVLEDLKELLPSGLLTSADVQAIARTYNITHGRIVAESERKVLISKQGDVDPTHVLDAGTGRVVGVNHFEGSVVPGSSREARGEVDGSLEQQRAEVARAVAEYVQAQYVTDEAASAVYASGGRLHVVIYGERVNLRNYWSGSWLSVWDVDPERASISGTIKLRAHYFEEGNVQMQTSKSYSSAALSEPLGPGVAQAINDFESSLQQGLEGMYGKMGDETFKAMRRKLTLAKTRMEWTTAAHRVARTLGK